MVFLLPRFGSVCSGALSQSNSLHSACCVVLDSVVEEKPINWERILQIVPFLLMGIGMGLAFVADHYQYLASIGPIALASAGVVSGRRV
jgi:hypothetical protein